MSTWPVTLPQDPELNGLQISQKDNSIRSGMSYGPDKVRRRTTSAITIVSFAMTLTTTEVGYLNTFYNDTIEVSGRFTWVDHLTGAAADYRFLQPPVFSPYGGDLWTVSFNMEQLP